MATYNGDWGGSNKYREDVGIRHAWVATHGFLESNPPSEELIMAMCNGLCHKIGFRPLYPGAFGGTITLPRSLAIGSSTAALAQELLLASSSAAGPSAAAAASSNEARSKARPSSSSWEGMQQPTRPQEPEAEPGLVDRLYESVKRIPGKVSAMVTLYEASGLVHLQEDTGEKVVQPVEAAIRNFRAAGGVTGRASVVCYLEMGKG